MKWCWHPKNVQVKEGNIRPDDYRCFACCGARAGCWFFLAFDVYIIFSIILLSILHDGVTLNNYLVMYTCVATLLVLGFLLWCGLASQRPVFLQTYLIISAIFIGLWLLMFTYLWLAYFFGFGERKDDNGSTTRDLPTGYLIFISTIFLFLMLLRGYTVWCYYLFTRDRHLKLEQEPAIVASRIEKKIDLNA